MKAKLIKVDNGWILMVDNIMYATDNDKLSLKNCQAIERGYDLDELAADYSIFQSVKFSHNIKHSEEAFKDGFESALELMGDKKFSEEDLLQAVEIYYGEGKTFIEVIQSLQQTEWDVEILMEKDEPKSFVKRKVIRKLDNGEEIEWTCFWDKGWFDTSRVAIPNIISWEIVPILDTNNCLILKKI